MLTKALHASLQGILLFVTGQFGGIFVNISVVADLVAVLKKKLDRTRVAFHAPTGDEE